MWVSNDIGRLNYILFLRMLIFMNTTFFLQIFLNVRAFISESSRYLDHDVLVILNIVTLVLVAGKMFFMTYLLLFHAYLVSKDKTTIKYLMEKTGINRASRVVTKVAESRDGVPDDASS